MNLVDVKNNMNFTLKFMFQVNNSFFNYYFRLFMQKYERQPNSLLQAYADLLIYISNYGRKR